MKNDHSPFAGMMRVMNHFFPHLADTFNQMEDPRHPAVPSVGSAASVFSGSSGSFCQVFLVVSGCSV